MKTEEFLKVLDKYYTGSEIKKDRKKLLRVIENRIDEYELLVKKTELKKAIGEYLKVKSHADELPEGLVDAMMDRIDKPITIEHIAKGVFLYE